MIIRRCQRQEEFVVLVEPHQRRRRLPFITPVFMIAAASVCAIRLAGPLGVIVTVALPYSGTAIGDRDFDDRAVADHRGCGRPGATAAR